MRYRILIIFNILLFFFSISESQTLSIAVKAIEGSATVQHHMQNQWQKLAAGDQVFDDDIIETDFQTTVTAQIDTSILFVLGPNSKTLVNIKPNETSDVHSELKLTLFSGGILTKTEKRYHLSVFTSNAVAEADSGTFSTITDSKTGESGVQVMNGIVNARNVTQNKGKVLNTGFTTIILPSKEPTTPLYMTNRHVTVLKHFFGDKYIQNILDISGVTPTEDKTNNRLSFSQRLSSTSTSVSNETMYKALFSLEKIYGEILEDQKDGYQFYEEILKSNNLTKRPGRVSLGTSDASGDDNVYTSYDLGLSYAYRFIDGGLRFSLNEPAASSKHHVKFNSAGALMDKLDHLTVGGKSDSMFLSIGPINSESYGCGLIVDKFSNQNLNNVYHTAGVNGQLRLTEVGVRAFVDDVTAPEVGGLFFNYEPTSYYIYAGYYFDRNTRKSLIKTDNYAYNPPAFNSFKESPKNGSVNIYEVDIGTDMAFQYDFQARIFCEFAQKIDNGNDGIVARIPSLLFDFSKVSFNLGLLMESGRLVSGVFDPFYMTQKVIVRQNEMGDTLIESPSSVLSSSRSSLGLSFDLKMNPWKWLDVALSYKQNLREKKTFVVLTDTTDSSVKGNLDYSYSFRCAINDSLYKYIRYAAVYVRQNHASLYPDGGSPFLSWNFDIGADIQSNPLFYNIAFETSCRYFYLDKGTGSDKLINKGEGIFQWYFGINWGLL